MDCLFAADYGNPVFFDVLLGSFARSGRVTIDLSAGTYLTLGLRGINLPYC